MTLFTHNCEKHGHRFEGRYDLIPTLSVTEAPYFFQPESLGKMIKDSAKKIYVKDICTRCGKEIER